MIVVLKRILSRIHAKVGDLWWYTALLFAAQRFGDCINVFVGLWIVPKYVPASELGAVLPITQFVSFVGIPLMVVATPFTKFLNLYAAHGEYGKIKSMLRDVFIGTAIMGVATVVLAWLVMPYFFERMRIAQGSLGLLIIIVAILGSVSTIFSCAVKGLQLYDSMVWLNVLAAPFRLILMLITMPFRAMSGYFVGQGASPSVTIVGSIWALRKRLGKDVKSRPYLKEDGRAILKYAVPLAVVSIVAMICTSFDMVVIRHRLSDFESAGYYMISRFADIASYAGAAFTAFLFPMVASKGKEDREARHVLIHAIGGTGFGGLIVAVPLLFFGAQLLSLNGKWSPYATLSTEMFVMALVNTATCVNGCLGAYEIAQGRFRYLWYAIPLAVIKTVGLYAITGYTFFKGMVPDALIDAIAAFNPCRLDFYLYVMLVYNVILCICYAVDVFSVDRKKLAKSSH